jgi:hypothetical protein
MWPSRVARLIRRAGLQGIYIVGSGRKEALQARPLELGII